MKIFDKISINQPKKSVFDLSHERKFSMNMGDLVPVLCQEVIPGDKFRINMEQLVRFMPLIAPMMHRVNVYTHFFFVPNRLVWNDWEKFITGGDKGIDIPVFPTFANSNSVSYLKNNDSKLFGYGSLLDYMGFPIKQIQDSVLTIDIPLVKISQLPFRAYQLIYNEYYRDQNLEEPITIPKTSGALNWQIGHTHLLLELRRRAWEKDYFTSALPYAQKGTQMELPLTGEALVRAQSDKRSVALGNIISGQDKAVTTGYTTSNGALYADMDNVSSTTVNELRQAFQIQKWLERNARGGTRYIEQILSHFGVKSSDARLQRPEYLGGGKTPVTISEVLQMSSSDETSPQGNMAGHGVSVGNSNQFSRYFEEHGMIIGIMSVIPRTAYMQGIPRLLSKTDRYDFYWPEFAHLGEQTVQSQELYWSPASESYNKSDFGYQPRYTEYRYIPDTVHGEFGNTLKFWHMAREFANAPLLNSDFVKCKGDSLKRPFPVQDDSHKLYVQTYCNIKAIRPIPKYGNPGGI